MQLIPAAILLPTRILMTKPCNLLKKIICCLVAAAMLLPPGAGTATAFTVGEERELGEKLLTLVRRQFRLIDDPDISQYINRLGREILTAAGPQFFDYHFFVINNKEFNAFAAPSGLIFFHSGLIEVTDSEGELVSVMAHEVGHAASRHYADRLSKSKKVSVGTAALALAGLAIGAGPIGQALMTGSLATGATLQLQFSRQDEEEADRLAYKWMQAANRDPAEMLGMLQKMRRITRYRQGKVPAYLLTHPEPENRFSYIEDRLYQDPPAPTNPADEFDFQRIKYRILVQTREPHDMLPIFLNKAREANGQDLASIMNHYGLFLIYLFNRDYVKAQAELALVMQRFPDRSILLADLGVLFLESGQLDRALESLGQAVARDPDNAYALFNQAVALQQNNKPAHALAIYEQLLSVIPDYSRLHYRIGQIKSSLGDKPAGHYHLGVYHWQEGDVKTARFHLKEAMRDQPETSPIRRQAKELLDTIERLEKMT